MNKEVVSLIIGLYNRGNTINEISENTGYHYNTVRNCLIKSSITLKSRKDYKWKPSEEDKTKILHLYETEKRGIDYISKALNTHWKNVKEFLNQNHVKLWDRKTIISSNIKHYGISKGFTGKKHSKKSKRKMSLVRIGNCNNVTGPKSLFIKTIVGTVQGSYEAAYLQKLSNDGLTLPKIGGRVKTSKGIYFPDFEFEDRFVEIKSPFTWKVCKGEIENGKGIKTNIQYQKIQWTSNNVKPVEIVILKPKEAHQLFLQAISNSQLVTEKIIYKNGKYHKQSLPLF